MENFRKFLHEVSNLLAIIQGNVHQANKALTAAVTDEATGVARTKLENALKGVTRLADAVAREKEALERGKGSV